MSFIYRTLSGSWPKSEYRPATIRWLLPATRISLTGVAGILLLAGVASAQPGDAPLNRIKIQLQRFHGLLASAIHRADPGALVATESASLRWNSTAFGTKGNYYTDQALQAAAGGDMSSAFLVNRMDKEGAWADAKPGIAAVYENLRG